MPFDGRSFKELVSQISEGRYEEPINRSTASSLIRWLLTPDILRRATITDVCKDSWVNQGYKTSLLEVAESMASTARLPREHLSATKLCLETNNKNGRDTSIFRKAATQMEEKDGKITAVFTKNLENTMKTNDVNSQPRRPSIYEQMTNYDVRFILNKLIGAVEASLNTDKNSQSTTIVKSNIANALAEKVDSAYVIPIFEVTSMIPIEDKESSSFNKISEKAETINTISKISPKLVISKTVKENYDQKKEILNNECKNIEEKECPENINRLQKSSIQNNRQSTDSAHCRKMLLTESQKQFNSLNISGQLETHKADIEKLSRKMQHDHAVSDHLTQKNKRFNASLPTGQKHPGPFMKTKHHVLHLARLLSLNYEKIIRNSFRIPTCKKKLPGKITIPPTFDPNNLPHITKKQQEEKKELLIFPTVSVSENKEKIQKKIEKIKKAALNKNIIIRSDSKTRMRIENYIRSQVKKIQDLVCEEQRSLHGSLDHLDEQSLRDMSEMYYCAFGSENTDSGIANNEDDEYFCFLCSKPNGVNGTSKLVDSLILESIKKGCLYTSNHLHIPRGNEQFASNNSNMEFGSLSRCKSEIKFPTEYLNYISSNKLDLNKRTHHKQQIQRNDIGNTKYFFTIPSGEHPDNSNLRILRSASDSVSLNFSKNTFEVVKLNIDNHDEAIQNYRLFPHFLEQTSNGCNYSEMTDYETQSSVTDTTFINSSQMLEKDDGIGDSNDSFQSYIDTLENNVETDSVISRSMSSQYMNFMKDNSYNNQRSSATFLSKFHSRNKYDSEYGELERQKEQGTVTADILNSTSWVTALDKENGFVQQKDKSRGLRRRNTMTCIRDKSETNEDYDQSKTEFENYLWNAYKEHLLENNQNDTEYSSSPNLNYYSFDKKAKFRSRDCKSMDYINGENSNDFISKNLPNFSSAVEQDSNEASSTVLKNILKHSNITKRLPDRSASHLNRTKSICSETLTDSDRDDIIRRLREEQKSSMGIRTLDVNSRQSPFTSNFLNDLERRDKGRKSNDSHRRRYTKSNLPLNKKTKSEYKKSFLQLLALKRIQEAEKELDKTHRSEPLNVEDENSGSLLEALKTHGYKSVISQRFQDTNDDLLDPFHIKYLKSPRNLRAELARLNYMYYESLPRYTVDPYEESDYLYDDLDYTRGLLNGLPTPSFYDMQTDYRKQASKQSVYDWLDTTQIDEYLGIKRPDSLYIPEETTPTQEMRRCCTQRGRENYRSFDDDSTSESQDTVEEFPSNGTFNVCSKNKELNISNETTNPFNSERAQTSAIVDDERQESVQDRIWRKSFYPRFNNRALSRKERSSLIEPESLSESRLGLLNNIYNPLKTGYEKSEISQWDGSNKSFNMKRSKKHSTSFDKFESRSSMKKKYSKPAKERETVFGNEACLNRCFTDVCNTAVENEEPEH